jgi:hypothetical protein
MHFVAACTLTSLHSIAATRWWGGNQGTLTAGAAILSQQQVLLAHSSHGG